MLLLNNRQVSEEFHSAVPLCVFGIIRSGHVETGHTVSRPFLVGLTQATVYLTWLLVYFGFGNNLRLYKERYTATLY